MEVTGQQFTGFLTEQDGYGRLVFELPAGCQPIASQVEKTYIGPYGALLPCVKTERGGRVELSYDLGSRQSLARVLRQQDAYTVQDSNDIILTALQNLSMVLEAFDGAEFIPQNISYKPDHIFWDHASRTAMFVYFPFDTGNNTMAALRMLVQQIFGELYTRDPDLQEKMWLFLNGPNFTLNELSVMLAIRRKENMKKKPRGGKAPATGGVGPQYGAAAPFTAMPGPQPAAGQPAYSHNNAGLARPGAKPPQGQMNGPQPAAPAPGFIPAVDTLHISKGGAAPAAGRVGPPPQWQQAPADYSRPAAAQSPQQAPMMQPAQAMGVFQPAGPPVAPMAPPAPPPMQPQAVQAAAPQPWPQAPPATLTPPPAVEAPDAPKPPEPVQQLEAPPYQPPVRTQQPDAPPPMEEVQPEEPTVVARRTTSGRPLGENEPRMMLVLVRDGVRTELPVWRLPCVVGRSSQRSGVVVPGDKEVSRAHARLVEQSDVVYVEDMNSTNGVVLNGRRLQPGERGRVHNGDIIQLSQSSLTVLID